MRHGAKVKLCSTDGCTNQVVRGGVCIQHGAIKRCSKEVCAAGMGLRLGSKHAAVKDVQTKLRKEECVLSMEQRRDAAAEKDVQIML